MTDRKPQIPVAAKNGGDIGSEVTGPAAVSIPAAGSRRPRPNGRTQTIKRLIDQEIVRTGKRPSVEEVAALLASSKARVEHHFRLLGFL